MQVWEVMGVAVGLGADAMSVCMGVGVNWHGARQKFRMAWHMGLFQFLMPILGWAIGGQLAGVLAGVGGYIASALVFGIGGKMLWEALKGHPGEVAEKIEEGLENAAEHVHHRQRRDPTRGWSLVGLSVATSIDALVVGFSLALRGQEIFLSSAVIGLVAAAMAFVGIIIGKRIGQAFGRHAEIGGAVVLMGLGVAFLWL